MTHTDVASSRPIGVARVLGSALLDEAAIFARPVVLTGERDTLLTANGRWCLLNSIRLLARIVGPLTIVLPPGLSELEVEARQLASSAWTRGAIVVATAGTSLSMEHAAAILNVGAYVEPNLPWTTINSNGWVARVSSGPHELQSDTDQPNPMAALMAASLGVAEVFKRVYGIPDGVATLLDAVQFSSFEFSTSPAGLGPALPAEVLIPDTVMVGAGAIGNGIALLLSQLHAHGRLHIIDKQAYGRENFGTCCVLDDIAWLGSPKAQSLASWLHHPDGLRCTGEQAYVADARSGDFVRGMSVELVLNGVDDVDARRDSQLLWPSVLVDGGINAVGAAVRTHRLDRPTGACMRCSFPPVRVDERAAQAKATGLSMKALESDLNRKLTEDDVTEADEAQREWLRKQLVRGKTVCSIISEAQSRSLGFKLHEGFSPSAPFVATASAALVMGQALKSLYWPDADFIQRFQLESIFIGPESSSHVLTLPNRGCECMTHRSVIEGIAARRRQMCEMPTVYANRPMRG